MHVMDRKLRAQDNERIPATFVLAGIKVERAGLLSGTRGEQIAGRYSMVRTGSFPLDGQWATLIAALKKASACTGTSRGASPTSLPTSTSALAE
jgi:hypothetical protein